MKANKRITVLLVDDHKILRDVLRNLLKAESDIEVVGEAANGRQAVELALRLLPVVVVMDIVMPKMSGLEVTRQILKAAPNTKVLIHSAHSDEAYVESATAMGAAGYLIKQTSAKFLCEAIRTVQKGGHFFSAL